MRMGGQRSVQNSYLLLCVCPTEEPDDADFHHHGHHHHDHHQIVCTAWIDTSSGLVRYQLKTHFTLLIYD